jgi:hypothetical protein
VGYGSGEDPSGHDLGLADNLSGYEETVEEALLRSTQVRRQ